MLLAGDIGGTKTNLAIYATDGVLRAPVAEATFPSAQYDSLEAVAQEFLSRVKQPVERACFGVAGPVIAGRATVTNLPWMMDEQHLRAALNVRSVKLLNDLEAIANAVPYLAPQNLHTLNAGAPLPGGSMAVIAPGTGLGEAYLTWDGTRYRAYASEGGHADFAPTNDFEIGLLHYLLHKFEHVSYERVCSGKGLPNLYNYIKDSGYADEPAWLTEKLAAAADPAPVIVNTALEASKGSELCIATLNLFVSILGAEAGNLTLKLGAWGGMYLGGGIPPRILSALTTNRFMMAFKSKGRLGQNLDVPIHVILDPNAALLGAARHGLDWMRD